MAEMLSPGVFTTEIDGSQITPTVSNSIGVFAGQFTKGPVESYVFITTVDELIANFGEPTDANYNDWYQCYNFLQYGNKIYIARAAHVSGGATTTLTSLGTPIISISPGKFGISGEDASLFTAGDEISFEGSDDVFYEVTSVSDVEDNIGVVFLDRNIETEESPSTIVYLKSTSGTTASLNAQTEAVAIGGNEASTAELYNAAVTVLNFDDLEGQLPTIGFGNSDAKLKLIARNPGAWGNEISVSIANSAIFGGEAEAFDGVSLDGLFAYAPVGDEIGVIVKVGDEIVEIFTGSFSETAKDDNNKTLFIENIINNQSAYIFAKVNTAETGDVANYVFTDGSETPTNFQPLVLEIGTDEDITAGDILTAYELWDNKEEVDIDIVIGNEANITAAVNLVDERKDCMAFLGADYVDIVGKKASVATTNLVEARKTGAFNFNNMFVVLAGNYKYQYDRYNDKNRWINIAGDIAGLRAATNTDRASWWASAGLERGQIKNIIKLAFNPNNGHRDLLYKNAINPVCSFPGQGTVMWGQKTLLSKASSFDRVNVRGLFNTVERSLEKMAKHQVMEFNDNFTRNRIVSMIKPFLGSVQAGRGIQEYLVICDNSNNTADVISRNQLVVDVYIKPTYVAEFIHLKFTNAGTNNFSEIVGG